MQGLPLTPEMRRHLQREVLVQRRQGFSFSEIGERIEQSTQMVYTLYREALDDIITEDVTALRKFEAAKLDALETEVHSVLQTFIPCISGGQVVYDAIVDDYGAPIVDILTGQPLMRPVQDFVVKLKSVDRVVKLMERRSKLLGLDRPTKFANTDAEGENVVAPIVVGMDLAQAATLYAQTIND